MTCGATTTRPTGGRLGDEAHPHRALLKIATQAINFLLCCGIGHLLLLVSGIQRGLGNIALGGKGGQGLCSIGVLALYEMDELDNAPGDEGWARNSLWRGDSGTLRMLR